LSTAAVFPSEKALPKGNVIGPETPLAPASMYGKSKLMAEEMLQSEDWKEKFFEQWVLREAYVKWTGEGLRIDMRTIEMEKGWHKLLPFQESYSCAVWSAKEMEIVWKKAEIELI
jgi:phosphopantetheinyl transferase